MNEVLREFFKDEIKANEEQAMKKGIEQGIELERKNTEKERLNTEKERQRADAATKKAAELENEVKKLRAMLAK